MKVCRAELTARNVATVLLAVTRAWFPAVTVASGIVIINEVTTTTFISNQVKEWISCA